MRTVASRRIDIFVSNPRHHLEIFRPVAAALQEGSGLRCRILSLCELRGFSTPVADLRAAGLDVVRLAPAVRRSPSSGSAGSAGRGRLSRGVVRAAAWRLVLRPRLMRELAARPDLVLLANDAAYPYDRIIGLLRRQSIPYFLFQEGIRFPLPVDGAASAYGTSGADALFVWGQSSREHFRRLGVPDDRIHVVGSPRFDRSSESARGEAYRLRSDRRRDGRTLLFLSNPIDDQGFCSTREKSELIQRFALALEPCFDGSDLRLIVKLHGRESKADFEGIFERVAYSDHVTILKDASLAKLLGRADAAVVMASTTGLEALMAGVPLGVLRIPGHGFVHDYVRSGAAIGLDADASLCDEVEALLGGEIGAAALDYLERALTSQPPGATRRAERLILEFLETVKRQRAGGL